MTDVPTEPGWYWWRGRGPSHEAWEVVRVMLKGDGGILRFLPWGWDDVEASWVEVRNNLGQWGARIEFEDEPQEEKK